MLYPDLQLYLKHEIIFSFDVVYASWILSRWMTVPKSRETRAVCMQEHGVRACNNSNVHNQKLCIYVATQGMRPCNSNSMCNPKLKDVGRGYACYYCCMLSYCTIVIIQE